MTKSWQKPPPIQGFCHIMKFIRGDILTILSLLTPSKTGEGISGQGGHGILHFKTRPCMCRNLSLVGLWPKGFNEEWGCVCMHEEDGTLVNYVSGQDLVISCTISPRTPPRYNGVWKKPAFEVLDSSWAHLLSLPFLVHCRGLPGLTLVYGTVVGSYKNSHCE